MPKKTDNKKSKDKESTLEPSIDREKLVKEMFALKKKESELKAKRETIMKKLLSAYGAFEGNSKTFNEKDFKVVVTYGMNISFVDEDKWCEDRKKIDPSLRPEKIKFAVDKKGFDFICDNKDKYPEEYKIISDNIVKTEKKPTIEITKK